MATRAERRAQKKLEQKAQKKAAKQQKQQQVEGSNNKAAGSDASIAKSTPMGEEKANEPSVRTSTDLKTSPENITSATSTTAVPPHTETLDAKKSQTPAKSTLDSEVKKAGSDTADTAKQKLATTGAEALNTQQPKASTEPVVKSTESEATKSAQKSGDLFMDAQAAAVNANPKPLKETSVNETLKETPAKESLKEAPVKETPAKGSLKETPVKESFNENDKADHHGRFTEHTKNDSQSNSRAATGKLAESPAAKDSGAPVPPAKEQVSKDAGKQDISGNTVPIDTSTRSADNVTSSENTMAKNDKENKPVDTVSGPPAAAPTTAASAAPAAPADSPLKSENTDATQSADRPKTPRKEPPIALPPKDNEKKSGFLGLFKKGSSSEKKKPWQFWK